MKYRIEYEQEFYTHDDQMARAILESTRQAYRDAFSSLKIKKLVRIDPEVTGEVEVVVCKY